MEADVLRGPVTVHLRHARCRFKLPKERVVEKRLLIQYAGDFYGVINVADDRCAGWRHQLDGAVKSALVALVQHRCNPDESILRVGTGIAGRNLERRAELASGR